MSPTPWYPFVLTVRPQLETSKVRFGQAPSIVVHNAGWSYPNKSGIKVTIEEFDRLFNVNVKSVYLASKILIPEMKKNGPGSTVVISSENAIRPGATQTWYNATKAGISSATKSMALEFAKDQLRFNTICPTSGNTPLLNKFSVIADGPMPAEIIKAKCASIYIGRLVEPSDVASVALFLAEPATVAPLSAELRFLSMVPIVSRRLGFIARNINKFLFIA